MNKKTLKVVGLVVFVAILIFIFDMPVISSEPVAGTCCPQYIATCVIGSHVIPHNYYLESGPCP